MTETINKFEWNSEISGKGIEFTLPDIMLM